MIDHVRNSVSSFCHIVVNTVAQSDTETRQKVAFIAAAFLVVGGVRYFFADDPVTISSSDQKTSDDSAGTQYAVDPQFSAIDVQAEIINCKNDDN